ncbi:MAG: hypothetical protein KAS59_04570 [Alphaproteobacteria bacterium]|nr:hypothetical protein [Alphaproteobacteria bacterium]
MDIIKSTLIKTVMVSAVAVLVFSSPQALAADEVSDLGHISASVTGVLAIDEVSEIKFGNFAVACTIPGACVADVSTIILSETGTRTTAGGEITLLYGLDAGHSGIIDGSDLETGGQAPGFYTVNAGAEGTGTQDVYISFSDDTGQIIDSNHPDNRATLTGPVGGQTFTVKDFTFDSDDGTDGYSGLDSTKGASDGYGDKIALVGGAAILRVGATLYTSTTVAAYNPGRYAGTYHIMVSY